MKTSFKTTLAICIIALIALLAPRSFATMADGQYKFEFNGNINIYDISGTYSEDALGIDVEYTINVDPTGHIEGQGSAHYEDGFDYLDADFTLTGSIKTSGAVTRVKITIHMAGGGVVQGYDAFFKATVKEKLEVDRGSLELVGTESGSVSVSVPGVGHRSVRIPATDVALDLPDGVDGSWTLDVGVTPEGTKFIGTGTVELSNGRTVEFTITGSYVASKDLSKLKLMATDANPGPKIKLSVTTDGFDAVLNLIKGKVLGQKFSFVKVP